MASKPKVTDSASVESSESAGTFQRLRHYLADKLHISNRTDKKKDKVLGEIANLIKNKKCNKIVTMAGAGISTSAGIPDFRSPGSGLYDNLQKYNLPYPQSVFEFDFFKENPKPFFALAKELYPGILKPTPCHYFLKLLEQKGLLLRHYTQNIDTLERIADISDEKLIEAHGSFFTGHCMNCRKEYPLAWMKVRIFADKIPICEKCPGVVKPDIVFFGENLPDKFYKYADIDLRECDLLIVMGSSLVVQPFATLVNRVSNDCPRLLINREKVGGGLQFDRPNNTKDVAWLGDCDEGCQLLADKLGWGEELKKLVADEHKRIDDEIKNDSDAILKKESKDKKTPKKDGETSGKQSRL